MRGLSVRKRQGKVVKGEFFAYGTIHAPLDIIGLDPLLIRSAKVGSVFAKDFWKRHGTRLPDVFGQAHECYRRAMKEAHSDKGGSHERSILINSAWARIKYLFGQHGVN